MVLWSFLLFFIFFFQAEDGIRDTSVTGVQTCALPILYKDSQAEAAGAAPEGDADAGAGGGEENVVDADFEEVDPDQDNK